MLALLSVATTQYNHDVAIRTSDRRVAGLCCAPVPRATSVRRTTSPVVSKLAASKTASRQTVSLNGGAKSQTLELTVLRRCSDVLFPVFPSS